MTNINPDSGTNALSPEEFVRGVMRLPAEDLTWFLSAWQRIADDSATMDQRRAEWAEYKTRRDGLGEGM